MMSRCLPLILFFFPGFLAVHSASAFDISLKGSPDSMIRQHEVATANGYEFVETPEDVEILIERHEMIPVVSNGFLTVLSSVSHPYARPEVRLFVERLAKQYMDANGEKLVVTSLTRPTSNQPWNAHKLSVHPAGLAVDFRISKKDHSRQWLEGVLLSLERIGVLDVTKETNPPHYHVALFPEAYKAYVADKIGEDALSEAMSWDAAGEEVREEPELDDSAERALPTAMAMRHQGIPLHASGASIALLLLAGGAGFWVGRRRAGGVLSRQNV